MGFWGMSSAGKNARNSLNNLGGWNNTQANEWMKRAEEQYSLGNFNNNWANEYWRGRAAQGYRTPGQIKAAGEEILPIQPTIERLNQTQARREEAYNNFNTDPYKQQINDATGQLVSAVGPTQDAAQGAVDTGYGNVGRIVDSAQTQSQGNIDATYGKAEGEWNEAFNRLRQENANQRQNQITLGDDMARRSMGYLENWEKDIETLKPGSEFAAARAARAFAPAKAATSWRMRRAGVDPDSVQASSMLGAVDSAQARAMDDAFADGQMDYVSARGQLTGAKTGLLGDYRDYTSGVIRDALGNEIGLGGTQASGNVNLTTQRGDRTQDVINDSTNARVANENNRAGATAAVAQQGFENTRAATAAQTESAAAQFGIDKTRYDDFQNLMDGVDKTTLTEVELQKAQYILGKDWNDMDERTRDNAAAMIQQLGSEQMRNMFASGEMASRFGQEAADLYKQIFVTESANAGWGLKGLMGLGMTLLAGPAGAAAAAAMTGGGRNSSGQSGGGRGSGGPGPGGD